MSAAPVRTTIARTTPVRAMNRQFARQVGFTLVELVIAMLIGLFVLLGLVVAFDSNRDSFRFNTQLLQLQDGGRLAMDAIIHDLRMAGDIGCMRSAMDGEDLLNDTITKVTINTAGRPANFRNDVEGRHLVLGVEPDNAAANSFSLHIYGIPVAGANAVLWSDCERSEVTFGGAATSVSPASYRIPTGYRTYVYRDGDPVNLGLPGTELRPNQLRVADPVVGGGDGVVLLDNVMHFAVCLGVDRNSTDGSMQGRVQEWVPVTRGGSATDDQLSQTISVQVQMVVASEPQGAGTVGQVLSVDQTPETYDFCDGSSFTASGDDGLRRLYKFFSSTAVLRNKVPNGYGEGGWLDAN
ncbi:MAG: PilW family protein [Betaproteobacteria bacterium]|nr:PilW family protein [Betaproteobacteria bacterium]